MGDCYTIHNVTSTTLSLSLLRLGLLNKNEVLHRMYASIAMLLTSSYEAHDEKSLEETALQRNSLCTNGIEIRCRLQIFAGFSHVSPKGRLFIVGLD